MYGEIFTPPKISLQKGIQKDISTVSFQYKITDDDVNDKMLDWSQRTLDYTMPSC